MAEELLINDGNDNGGDADREDDIRGDNDDDDDDDGIHPKYLRRFYL